MLPTASFVTRLVAAAALYAAYRLSFRTSAPLFEPQHSDSGGHNCSALPIPRMGNNSSRVAHIPRWEHDPSLVPYMGNLTCPFEVAHHSVEVDGKNKRSSAERCGRLRYVSGNKPYKPPPTVDGALDRLRDGSTIYVVGDSVSRQHFVDLACRLAGEARLLEVETDPEPAAVDRRGPTAGYGLNGATFGPYGSDRTVRVVFRAGNMGLTAPNANKPRFRQLLGGGKEGDVYVVNAGLHVSSLSFLWM